MYDEKETKPLFLYTSFLNTSLHSFPNIEGSTSWLLSSGKKWNLGAHVWLVNYNTDL